MAFFSPKSRLFKTRIYVKPYARVILRKIRNFYFGFIQIKRSFRHFITTNEQFISIIICIQRSKAIMILQFDKITVFAEPNWLINLSYLIKMWIGDTVRSNKAIDTEVSIIRTISEISAISPEFIFSKVNILGITQSRPIDWFCYSLVYPVPNSTSCY